MGNGLTMKSPLEIELLIHFYACAEDHPRRNAPAVEEAICNFVLDGIFELRSNRIQVTEKGRAWLKVILSTEYPSLAWVDKNGQVIDTKN